MIKIKNPYSKKRSTLKEKIERKVTKFIVPWIKKIPLNEEWKEKPKFIPQFLYEIRIRLEYWDRDFDRNDIPEGVEVNLLSIYVAEYIPIENIDKLNKGLKKIFKEFAPKRMNTNDLTRIDDFCNEVRQSIHGRRWSKFGFLEVDENNQLKKFVKQISVNGTQISSSSVIIEFVIIPSDNFVKEYKQIIESNVKDETILTPKLKHIFSFWGSKTKPGTIVKEQRVEDLLLELKWRTTREIGKYFEMYFSKNKLIPPSIEVYKIKQKSCKFKYSDNEPRNDFWNSVGMNDFPFYEISRDGYWQLFANEKDNRIGSSVKLTCNDEVRKEDLFHTLDFQLVYFVRELAMYLLPILVMRSYIIELSRQIAVQQKNTFKSLKKERPNYNKLINIRYELEQNLQILRRFKNEMGENEFENVKGKIAYYLNEFEPARSRRSYTSWAESIVDNASYLIEKTDNLSQNFAEIIDDTVKLLEIKTNNSLRNRTFVLVILTVLISFLATAIAATSLFLQLSEPNQEKLKEFILSALNFFY
ncbi:hypothetical protein BKP45_04880 [Anaerobacillus alkalidiazotrophicus]|uniref:Uncharacterized protein n=1 Tax=Anaerobacillus alkalidiazotrophicus TaxID=472963 RepID=A0A1S2MBT4_9BACI|nr:hypothetical protein [Anaerobacillus alkalidiazotrophicus]OIJ22014.1 hypothetical protein BKP45_04880 [Anaerobacillus alkalidiazotrophicus]